MYLLIFCPQFMDRGLKICKNLVDDNNKVERVFSMVIWPNSAWGSIWTMTMGKTHLTLYKRSCL